MEQEDHDRHEQESSAGADHADQEPDEQADRGRHRGVERHGSLSRFGDRRPLTGEHQSGGHGGQRREDRAEVGRRQQARRHAADQRPERHRAAQRHGQRQVEVAQAAVRQHARRARHGHLHHRDARGRVDVQPLVSHQVRAVDEHRDQDDGAADADQAADERADEPDQDQHGEHRRERRGQRERGNPRRQQGRYRSRHRVEHDGEPHAGVGAARKSVSSRPGRRSFRGGRDTRARGFGHRDSARQRTRKRAIKATPG